MDKDRKDDLKVACDHFTDHCDILKILSNYERIIDEYGAELQRQSEKISKIQTTVDMIRQAQLQANQMIANATQLWASLKCNLPGADDLPCDDGSE